MSATMEVKNNGLPTVAISTLPMGLTATAFVGIAWYLAIEFNVRLLFTFTRQSLYLWSCVVCSWGIIIHNLAITLFSFRYWTEYSSVVTAEISWFSFVVSQLVILYSRLELLMKRREDCRWVLYMVVVVAIVFGFGTVVVSLVGRHPSMIKRMGKGLLIWDKFQVAAFFLSETLISLLYIRETSRYLKERAPLVAESRSRRTLLRRLLYVNLFIIFLDCSSIGLCYADFFFLQGHYRVAVYAIKLRAEFNILNQLRASLHQGAISQKTYGQEVSVSHGNHRNSDRTEVRDGSQDSGIDMVRHSKQIKVVTEVKVERDPEDV